MFETYRKQINKMIKENKDDLLDELSTDIYWYVRTDVDPFATIPVKDQQWTPYNLADAIKIERAYKLKQP